MQSITNEQLEQLKEFILYTEEDVDEILSNYHPADTTFLIDVSFYALIDNLLYNGLTYDEILNFIGVMYGMFIDIL